MFYSSYLCPVYLRPAAHSHDLSDLLPVQGARPVFLHPPLQAWLAELVPADVWCGSGCAPTQNLIADGAFHLLYKHMEKIVRLAKFVHTVVHLLCDPSLMRDHPFYVTNFFSALITFTL